MLRVLLCLRAQVILLDIIYWCCGEQVRRGRHIQNSKESSNQPGGPPSAPRRSGKLFSGDGWGWIDLVLSRTIFIALAVAATYYLRPFHLPAQTAGFFGGFLGVLGVLLEMRLRRTSLKRLLGGVIGALVGILCAYLISLVLKGTPIEPRSQSFIEVALLLIMAYLGMSIGAMKGDLLNLQASGLFGSERVGKNNLKVLDTSVIIDGRIVDIFEAGFLDGTILLPQFMLHELQLVADSSDSLKRNRGRRGLDILQRIQKMPNVTTQIVEEDYPQIREVDLKLIEMGKRYDAKIVTNDFNLNKVAQLQGVDVLNINELANALKPVVLPGECMRVFLLKEGKEPGQGVAYLDDGTMVVVDNARRNIGRTIDIIVTSVLQTTAGKMIFGRFGETPNGEAAPGRERERDNIRDKESDRPSSSSLTGNSQPGRGQRRGNPNHVRRRGNDN